ncbi:MAG: hypothetical protein M1285_05455 [Candidatus Thermoplasmatota archaeon]|nr:hypothetical protein [Candidatus Thermoplasmatota archaeon]
MAGSDDERMERILRMIEDLEPTLRTVKKLQESGLMAVVDALAEQSDVLFNYASTMDLLGTASALVRFIPLISSAVGDMDPERFEAGIKGVSWNSMFSLLLAVMESVGKGMEKVEIPSSRPGTLALLSEARSPEMAFLIRLMREIARGVMDQETKNREGGIKPQE